MGSLFPLLKKELLEFTRTSKLIWVPIVFTLIGIIQPLTLYYMEDILRATNSMPEGMSITLAVPTAADALKSMFSQFSTVGTLIIIGTTMSCIFEEYRFGQATLLFVRPVSKRAYLFSKLFAYSLLFIASFLVSFLLTYYYVFILYDSLSFAKLAAVFFLISMWIIVVVSITLLFSSFLQSNSAIFGVTTLFLGVLALAQSIIPEKMRWSPTNIFTIANDIFSTNDVKWQLTTICSLLIIVFTFFIALLILNRKIIKTS